MQKDFTLTASAVDGGATQVVTTVDGTTSHESALDVPKGSEVKVEAEFHFEDGSSYTTTDSEYVTWTVSPEDSGVTVDENGMVDTSGVTGSEEVVVTITATGHGPFEGVTKTTTMTITAPDFSTLNAAACGGQLNDTDKENAKGACLKIATNDAGQWFTSSPSLAMMEALGYTQAAGNVDTNGGRTYVRLWTESNAGNFALFDQRALGTGVGPTGQYDRWCHDLASMRFGGRDDWRRGTVAEFATLSNDNEGIATRSTGFPDAAAYWSSTSSGGVYYLVSITGGYSYLSSPGTGYDYYASCVSGA
ncbi:hypothetical protein BOO26_19885 [Vibrio navarrensis]|nr:hypothetical protein [Vibrio navarrensis]